MSFEPEPPPVVRPVIRPYYSPKKPSSAPWVAVGVLGLAGVAAFVAIQSGAKEEKRAVKPTETPKPTSAKTPSAEPAIPADIGPRYLRDGAPPPDDPIYEFIKERAESGGANVQPTEPPVYRFLASDNDFTPEKKAVREWLKRNTHTGEWEEVSWHSWKEHLKYGTITGQLRLRTKNEYGATVLENILFTVDDGVLRSADYWP